MATSEKRKTHDSFNDWGRILDPTMKKGMISSSASQPSITDHQPCILPLKNAFSNLQGIDPQQIYLALKKQDKPVIFHQPKSDKTEFLIIKFTGKEDYLGLLDLLDGEYLNRKASSTIISPTQLTRLGRKKEAQLVKKACTLFNPTYFIKLPLFSLDEYLVYAQKTKCSLLILPFSDLLKYIKLLKEVKNSRQTIAAAFLPSHFD